MLKTKEPLTYWFQPVDLFYENLFNKDSRLKEIYDKLRSDCKMFKKAGNNWGIRDGRKINVKSCLNEHLFLETLTYCINAYLELKSVIKPVSKRNLRTALEQDIKRTFKTFVPDLKSTRSIHEHIENICKCFQIPYPSAESARLMGYQPKPR